jgi:hypothetical protein
MMTSESGKEVGGGEIGRLVVVVIVQNGGGGRKAKDATLTK